MEPAFAAKAYLMATHSERESWVRVGSDEEIVEVVGTVALATLSNYVAGVAQPDLDFKDAPELE